MADTKQEGQVVLSIVSLVGSAAGTKNGVGPFTDVMGQAIVTKRDITTETIVYMCDALSRRFEKGYEFVPDASMDGGIAFSKWPGRTDAPHQYKAFRFDVKTHPDQRWPIIEDGKKTLDEWKKHTKHPLLIWGSRDTGRKNRYQEPIISGFLRYKTRHGAPCWTAKEIGIIEEVMRSLGFSVRWESDYNRVFANLSTVGKKGALFPVSQSRETKDVADTSRNNHNVVDREIPRAEDAKKTTESAEKREYEETDYKPENDGESGHLFDLQCEKVLPFLSDDNEVDVAKKEDSTTEIPIEEKDYESSSSSSCSSSSSSEDEAIEHSSGTSETTTGAGEPSRKRKVDDADVIEEEKQSESEPVAKPPEKKAKRGDGARPNLTKRLEELKQKTALVEKERSDERRSRSRSEHHSHHSNHSHAHSEHHNHHHSRSGHDLAQQPTRGGYEIRGGRGMRRGYEMRGGRGYGMRGGRGMRGGYGMRGDYEMRGVEEMRDTHHRSDRNADNNPEKEVEKIELPTIESCIHPHGIPVDKRLAISGSDQSNSQQSSTHEPHAPAETQPKQQPEATQNVKQTEELGRLPTGVKFDHGGVKYGYRQPHFQQFPGRFFSKRQPQFGPRFYNNNNNAFRPVRYQQQQQQQQYQYPQMQQQRRFCTFEPFRGNVDMEAESYPTMSVGVPTSVDY